MDGRRRRHGRGRRPAPARKRVEWKLVGREERETVAVASGTLGKERRSERKSLEGEVEEGEEASTQSMTAATASGGTARKQLSRAASAMARRDGWVVKEWITDGSSSGVSSGNRPDQVAPDPHAGPYE